MSRILVIDDDPHIRRVLRTTLESRGFEVVEASDGATGLQVYRQAPVDLVVTDVFMPGKDGLEAIKELRAANPAIKIIAMTGGGNTGMGGMLHMATLLGAECTMSKPFLPSQLIAAVGRLIPIPQEKPAVS